MTRALLPLAITLALLAGCGTSSGPAAPQARRDVSGVAFEDAQGKRHTLAEFKGKVVLVDVWATWCPPCRRSLPEVAALQGRAGDAFAVLAISVDQEGWAKVGPFLRENAQMGLQAVVPAGRDGLAPFGSIAAIPTTLVVDRHGRLRERWSGYAPGRAEQALEQALREPWNQDRQ